MIISSHVKFQQQIYLDKQEKELLCVNYFACEKSQYCKGFISIQTESKTHLGFI